MYAPPIDRGSASGRARLRRPQSLLHAGACLMALVLAGAGAQALRAQALRAENHPSAAKSAGVPSSAVAARPIRSRPPGEPVDWAKSEHEITVDGRIRTYRLVRPKSLDPDRLPMLVVLHGRTMNPAATEEQTGFLPVVGRAIVVYPAGFGASWNAGACCGEAHAAGVDDVGFVTAVVRQIRSNQADASGKVYVVGYSNGGRLAYRLACEAPGLFAGVAAVEAAPVLPCPKPPPVPMMIVASTADPLIHMEDAQPAVVVNGYAQPSMTHLAATWAEGEGCTTSAVHHPAPALTTTVWTGCAQSSRVALAAYEGGSHAWPAGDEQTPSAQRLVWRFFHPPSASAGDPEPF